MAKIRGIKPDFWTDEDIADLSIPARLLFIGMWTHACDNGHLDDKPRQLKMKVFPADDIDISPLLVELVQARRIVREDGTITIPKFAFHQRPHKRWWTTCDLPLCTVPDGAGQPWKRSKNDGSPRGDNGGATVGQPHDVEGDGDGDGELHPSDVVAAGAAKPKRATQRPSDFRPSEAHVALASERGVDLHAEWAKFCDWCDANGKTYKDWPAALRNWIRNARPTIGGQQRSRVQQHLDLARQLAAEENGQASIGELA